MIYKAAVLLSVSVIFHSCAVIQVKEEPNKKVKSTLYYESLCMGCHMFIKEQLVPVWNILSDYMTVELVPYGNAEREFIDGHWQFTCQHGEPECAENLVHACAVKFLQDKNTTKLLKFVNCMVTEEADTLDDKTKLCTKKEGLNTDKINSCVASPDSEQLIVSMAIKTENVNPPLKWVPTVTIDEVHNPDEDDEILENFKGVICNHLDDPQPQICK